MRTTLEIDDDVLAAARALAESRGSSIGRQVSELARRGLEERRVVQDDDDLPSFAVSREAKAITPEDVERALDE